MRAKSAIRLAGLAALGLAGLAACATPSGPGRGGATGPRVVMSGDALILVSFDDNHDLKVDASEIDAGIAREWTRADANHDGSLSPLEFNAWAEAAMGGNDLPPYRLNFDQNVDNSISETEFGATLHTRANEYDKDHDSLIARAELLRPLAQPRMLQDDRAPGDGGPSGEHHRRPPSGG